MRKGSFLTVYALMFVLSLLSGLHGAPTGAQSKKEIEGATVEDNKVTLKAGYEFVRHPNNGLSVRKKGANKPDPPPSLPAPSLVCACTLKKDCEGGGGCNLSYTATEATCKSDGCCSCAFIRPK